jgi:hypothetical protein
MIEADTRFRLRAAFLESLFSRQRNDEQKEYEQGRYLG